MKISIAAFLVSIVLFGCYSCKKDSDPPIVPEKPELKGWHLSSSRQVWIEDLQEFAWGTFSHVINFKNDSCFIFVDVNLRLYSDTTTQILAQYNVKAPFETFGQFTKIGKYTPEGYPEYLFLPEDFWIIDSTRGDSLYFLPTITWTQISGTVGEVPGSTFYFKDGNWWHNIYHFKNDSLIAYLYREYSEEIPTGNWSEIIRVPIIYSGNSYQLIWDDQGLENQTTIFMFYDELWITMYNDLRGRLLLIPYIKK